MKKSKTPTLKQFASAARKMYEKDGHIEFDDEPKVMKAPASGDDGAYVAAWVWVPSSDAKAVQAWMNRR